MARFFLLHHTACLPERLILQTGHASSEEHCQWPNCDSRKHLCPTVPGERPVNLYYIDPSRIRRVCSVQLLSHVQLFATHELQHARLPCPSPTPWVQTNPCPLSGWCHPTISFCHPLLLPSIFPSIRVFSNESALWIRWPKCWSFTFNISPTNEEHEEHLNSWQRDTKTWFQILALSLWLHDPRQVTQFQSFQAPCLAGSYLQHL